MNRRDALQRLGVLVGGAFAAPVLSGLLSGCRPTPTETPWTPAALSAEQADLLGVIVDHIIPETDTPGARGVGVHRFIDQLVAEWMDEDETALFMSGLASFEEEAAVAAGTPFADWTPDEQAAHLRRLDAETIETMRQAEVGEVPFFGTLKNLTLVGYYTSEAGATEELRWLAAPGIYNPCMPVEEVGRAWA